MIATVVPFAGTRARGRDNSGEAPLSVIARAPAPAGAFAGVDARAAGPALRRSLNGA